MSTGLILIAVALFIAVFVYRKPNLERKLLKQIPLTYWINLVVVPALLYLGLAIIVGSILSRERVEIMAQNDFFLLVTITFTMMGAYVGHAIHSVAKVLWHYLVFDKNHAAYKVNEFFHGKFSHYLIFTSSLLTLLGIALLEVNYPMAKPLNKAQMIVIISGAIIFGASSIKGFRKSKEDYYRKLTYVCTITFVIDAAVLKYFNISVQHYQFNTFLTAYLASITGIYALRPIIIKTRLDRYRKLRHLLNALSIHESTYHQ
jgi:predicted acetyltransferase